MSTLLQRLFSDATAAKRQLAKATLLFEREEKSKALQAFERGASRFPTHSSDFQSAAASLLMRNGQWEEARKFWISATHCLKRSKRRSTLLRREASVYMLNGATCAYLMHDRKSAAIDMVTALALDHSIRKTREYLLLQARLLKPSSPEEAAEVLIKGARQYPTDHALNYDAADLLLKLRRYQEGITFATRAARINSRDEPSRRLLTELSEKAALDSN
ncbi:hypothetical protein [Sinorhizobium sp. M4_45]|uniref:tetratricopeptide repeat protein n=1 Tax=Sinorhizobium sp. M4_45 TaxID=2037901 RepID=UPI0011AF6AD7|nr:hypothetical protein [Sinorhizobium sp. M4_45]